MNFNIPYRIRKFDDKHLAVINLIIEYIEKTLRDYPPEVTYTTSMNVDVAGNTKDIVFCSTDSKFYGCTSGGAAGSAVWVAFH